jgi:hypothetical protein
MGGSSAWRLAAKEGRMSPPAPKEPLTKERMAQAEAALRAEEQLLKEKWCALQGHRWDLPAVSPFNHDIFECGVICNRCNAHATLTITIDKDKK